MFDVESSLQLVIDKTSLSSTAKNISDSFNKAFSGSGKNIYKEDKMDVAREKFSAIASDMAENFKKGLKGQENIYKEDVNINEKNNKFPSVLSGEEKELLSTFRELEKIESDRKQLESLKSKYAPEDKGIFGTVKSAIGGGEDGKGPIGGLLKGLMGSLGPIAIGVAIVASIMEFIQPIFKLLGMVLLLFMIPFFKAVKPFLKDVPDKLENIIKALSGSIEKAGIAAKDVSDFGSELSNVTDSFLAGDIPSAIQNTSKAFDSFKTSLISISDFMSSIPIVGTVWDIGLWIGDNIGNILRGFFDIGWWLGENIMNILYGAFDFGYWLGDNIKLFINGIFNIGNWLLNNISTFLIGMFDMGKWILDNIISFVEGMFDIGEWLYDAIGNFIIGTFDLGNWLGNNIGNFVTKTGGGITKTAENVWNQTKKILNIDDAIVKSSGEIIKFNPSDNILAMKNFGTLGGKGEVKFNFAPVYNISASTDRNDLKRILEEHNKNQRKEINSMLSYVTNLRG